MKQLAYGLLTGFLTLGSGAGAEAQVIQRRGDGDVFIDHRLDRLLDTGRYVAVLADTTIAAGDTVRTNLLVLGSRLYLEGAVEGDLVGIESELFLRPGSRVQRDVVNVGGGLYRSELAETGGRTLDLRRLPYEIREEDGAIVIVSREHRSPLELDGAYGFRVPEYNRVDGFAPDWGFTYTFRPIAGGVAPGVRGLIGYRTERGELAGGGSAFLQRGATALEGGWLRETRSNDRWIRGDTRNSVDFLIDGGDMRYYYEADVAFGELRHRLGDEQAEKSVTVGLRFVDEQTRSLRAGNPWTAFGPDTLMGNVPMDQGTIRSLIPFADAEWLTPRTATDVRLEVENGWSELTDVVCAPPVNCAPLEGSFTRLRIDSEFAMQALLDHTIEIELQFFLPLAGDEPLPRQRWGLLGGSGTLRTVVDAAFHGDHLAYSETEYIIPFRRLRLPILGVPELQLLHLAGRAWTGDRDGDFVQNVGARLQIWAFYVRWLTDPATSDAEVTLGLSWPFDSKYPWQE